MTNQRLLLDEEEGPEVVRGHGEEGDEILGLDHFTLRDKNTFHSLIDLHEALFLFL